MMESRTLLESAQRLGDSMGHVIEVMREAVLAFQGISSFETISFDKLIEGIQPTAAYRVFGCPYGKNTRGKKRWLLEIKQNKRSRALPGTPVTGERRRARRSIYSEQT